MLSVNANGQRSDERRLDAVLREVVEALAGIDRTPCSPGER
jgi:hypothetical protein